MLHLCILEWKINSLLSPNRCCGLLKFFSDGILPPEKPRICGYPAIPAGAASPLSFFLFSTYFMMIGAKKRSHHLNMRAGFETFTYATLLGTYGRVFDPSSQNRMAGNLFFRISVPNLKLLPASWDPLKVREVCGTEDGLSDGAASRQRQQQRHPASVCERPLCAAPLTYSCHKR